MFARWNSNVVVEKHVCSIVARLYSYITLVWIMKEEHEGGDAIIEEKDAEDGGRKEKEEK